LVFQLFSFLVVCSDMISKGFGLVAFFASVKAGSVCVNYGHVNTKLGPIPGPWNGPVYMWGAVKLQHH